MLVFTLALGHPLLAFSAGQPRYTQEKRCLTLAMYWEAREEGRKGMTAIGWVILNRLKSKKFPRTICEVVRQKRTKRRCQFAFWCDGRSDEPKNRKVWKMANHLAAKLLSKPPRDPTRGALFFHSDRIRVPWAIKRKRTVHLGCHIYYR
jgi:spore germination cell wall hydrolase CwlJ-like protein